MDDSKAICKSNRLGPAVEVGEPDRVSSETPTLPIETPPTLAFEAVVGDLRRFVWGVVRSSALVDDVIQATYLKAVEKGAAAHPDTARGWLFRVAYREALVLKRREAIQTRTTQQLATLPTRSAPRPDENMIQSETVAAVRQAMSALSEPQRRVVLARMHGDQTFAQIAAEAGLPLGTVLTHMRRALEKMRRVLDPGE